MAPGNANWEDGLGKEDEGLLHPPLEGIRVVDLTWFLAGPYASMILCDLGAEVIKIERPSIGDPARKTGPFIKGISSYFLSVNRGKKSLTLNLKSQKGKDILLALVETADVVIENFVPGTMERLGLSYEIMRQRNERLIYAACSGFGRQGPYANGPAFDIIIQAMSGTMSITGHPNSLPTRVGFSIGDIAGGLFTAIGILAALHERSRNGKGQMVDISLLDCQVALLENAVARYLATGEVPDRLGTRHPLITPFQAFPTRDGHIVVAAGNDVQWAALCEVVGRRDLLNDARFISNAKRTENWAQLEHILSGALSTRSTKEWLAELSAVGIPCSPINTIEEVFNHPQLRQRDMIIEVTHSTTGGMKVVGTPLKLSRSFCGPRMACPELGQHTREILRELLHMDDRAINSLREEGVI